MPIDAACPRMRRSASSEPIALPFSRQGHSTVAYLNLQVLHDFVGPLRKIRHAGWSSVPTDSTSFWNLPCTFLPLSSAFSPCFDITQFLSRAQVPFVVNPQSFLQFPLQVLPWVLNHVCFRSDWPHLTHASEH